MFTVSHQQSISDIHRHFLQERLERRARSAQADPTMLAMLSREAQALGLEFSLGSGLEQALIYPCLDETTSRRDRTIDRLTALRVDHSC